jgi:hypothetical protein
MNEELLVHRVEICEKRLDNHGGRLDNLEQEGRELKTELKNLCENLKMFTNILKWFIGLWVTTLLGFFIKSIH